MIDELREKVAEEALDRLFKEMTELGYSAEEVKDLIRRKSK